VVSITPRVSLEAHRLIEEMMVQANVCAAQTLEAKRTPLIYRIHDTSSDEKMVALSDFLPTVGLSWSKGQPPTTARFQRPAGRRARDAERRDRERGGPAHPDAGGLLAREHRSLRPESRPLCALHLAHPALCGPGGPPGADPGA
jgi:hypothetical protein